MLSHLITAGSFATWAALLWVYLPKANHFQARTLFRPL